MFQSGRQFNDKKSTASSIGWSKVIWDLLEDIGTRKFTRGGVAAPRGLSTVVHYGTESAIFFTQNKDFKFHKHFDDIIPPESEISLRNESDGRGLGIISIDIKSTE